ncbi:MAG: nitrate reductase subunit alpha [Corynebacterium sp.]|uniref:nitrate reductase subunit alpha n=1 Tax=Corynebacterium TaxID=1716 RepID=UPI001EF4A299|nr:MULTISPECIES: nitrate reductase subunit alpha [unclassified Corynebacterium]MCG7444997.1 nitrate reductase subunit alpha [Corynebacterium sp. ACRPO]MDU2586281.1 nitrate reductase subunit alpha [Corynebacterium sp.]
MTTHVSPENGKLNPLFKLGAYLRKGEATDSGQQLFLKGGRQADVFYRNRWAFDKMVRSTHGVNCTGSCSWKVYVKDGVITWESQAVDYPTTGNDMPEYEPRGCPRGASFSWYTYSPTRVRYPYARGVLVDMFREEKAKHGDSVLAWRAIQEDPEKRQAYISQRGKGGLIRISYEEAIDIASAAHVYTIRKYGPDRINGFTVIPAMSQISYGAGMRFLQSIGGVALSFYDWYADLPPASPQTFGDQTDVPESGDWYNSSYLMMWGSNIPVTRTPDAHFMVESRYKGTKVVVVSPDFADNTKFADEWARIEPGTDAALAFAMGHVILKTFHVDRQEPYFLNYMRKFTDSPFLVALDDHGDGTYTPGKFLTAAQLADASLNSTPNSTHRGLVMEEDGRVVDPGGTVADRWDNESSKWNLALDNADPVMSIAETDRFDTAEVLFPRFDLDTNPEDVGTGKPIGAGVVHRGVPVREVDGKLVTTVFDIMLAHYGVNRADLNLPGSWPKDFHDASEVGTPAWQEELTGVPADAAIRIGREFAQNAADSQGRSQIIMGAGVNHYFHADTIYRTFLALTSMCGTQGVNGGGWAHYVGQEKLRPVNGWTQWAMATDWQRPPRHMITTGFYYFATEQYRYDNSRASHLGSPLASRDSIGDKMVSDTMAEAMRRGWMPAYPQFNRNSLFLADEAEEAGMDINDYVVQELESGRLEFSYDNPSAEENWPRILLNWRTNLLGSSAKGTEFFLRHLLGIDSDATAEELAPEDRPRTIKWVDEAPKGKLDLMMTTDFRNTSTTLVSDLIFPAATWYEKHDMSSTDMHPYLHSFNAAINPPWEARSDYEVFRDLAAALSDKATKWLGVQRDVITQPSHHDTPDELGMPNGVVPDVDKQGLIPGVTMPKLHVVERDYTKIYEKWAHLGPLPAKLGTGVHGTKFNVEKQVKELELICGTSETSMGELVDLSKDAKVIDAILHLSGVSNGELAKQGFEYLSSRTGKDLTPLGTADEDVRITWDDIKERPKEVITSPEWTADKRNKRRYTAFSINVEFEKPWHTLTGRMQYYIDHDWYMDYGESLPIFRPPLDHVHMHGEFAPGETLRNDRGEAEVTLRYLTTHNKWSIHSQYFDNLHVLSISRGGQVVWMSNKDAEKIGVADNDWVEVYNRNGVVSARAIVSHRIPEGTMLCNHAQERTVGTPLNEHTGRRGGTHNSLTRISIKPVHIAGGYGQLTYHFNYIGPTGNNRDEVTRVRRRSQEVSY